MVTQHYRQLVDDLNTARKITYKVNPISCTTIIQELKVKSYIFLAHAAIEQYVEALVLDVSRQALDQYVQSQKVSRALIGLISSGLLARVEESGLNKKVKKEPFENIGLFATTAYGRFRSLVGDNNGIKIENQTKLFLPIGVDPATEDPVTMAALDSFGGKRGAIAHEFKIAKIHSLSEIDSDLETIRSGLPTLDQSCTNALA